MFWRMESISSSLWNASPTLPHAGHCCRFWKPDEEEETQDCFLWGLIFGGRPKERNGSVPWNCLSGVTLEFRTCNNFHAHLSSTHWCWQGLRGHSAENLWDGSVVFPGVCGCKWEKLLQLEEDGTNEHSLGSEMCHVWASLRISETQCKLRN